MVRTAAAFMVLGVLVGCYGDSACAGVDCTDESSENTVGSACEALDIDAEVSTNGTGDQDDSVWAWERCYLFELEENAVVDLSSNTSLVVPTFTLHLDWGEDVYPTGSGIGTSYSGQISVPLPKGRYALVASSATRGDFEFRLGAKYQTLPSPAQEPADFVGDREEMVELVVSPSVEVQEYVGGIDALDYYRFSLSESSLVTVQIDRLMSTTGYVSAAVYADEGDTATDSNRLFGASHLLPEAATLPAGNYLVAVEGSGMLYSLKLTAAAAAVLP